jgi:hypothetical protein
VAIVDEVRVVIIVVIIMSNILSFSFIQNPIHSPSLTHTALSIALAVSHYDKSRKALKQSNFVASLQSFHTTDVNVKVLVEMLLRLLAE